MSVPRTVAVAALAALAATALLVPGTANATPTASGHIRGTVTAFDGTRNVPAGNVLVRVTANSSTNDQPAVTTVTNADGTYALPALLPWTYGVCFVLQDDALRHLGPTGLLGHCHGADPSRVGSPGTLVTVGTDATTVVDETLPRAAAVAGTLVDELGRPVAGGKVSAENYDEFDAVTGSDGRYLIKGVFGTEAQMCAFPAAPPAAGTGSANRCASSTASLTLGEVTPFDLSLVAGGGLRGRVRDAAGRPVAGVLVFAYSTTRGQATTAADGSWSIAQLPTEQTTVCLTPPTDTLVLPTCVGPFPVTARKFIVVPVTLSTGIAVHGTVSDRDGSPLANLQVYVSGVDSDVVTGADGSYSLPTTEPRSAVCASPYPTVSGYANGYVGACVDLAPGASGSVHQDIRLARSGALAGRITDRAGRPVAGIAVTAIGFGDDNFVDVRPAVTTGADGRYLVRNLATEHSYEVHVDTSPDGDVPVRDSRAPAGWLRADTVTGLTVSPPGRTTVPTVQLSPAAGVDIRLVDPDGRPVTRGAVHIGYGNADVRNADTAGRLLVGNWPAGPLAVCATALTPGPLYPTGLQRVCRTVTLHAGVLTPLTLQQPAGS